MAPKLASAPATRNIHVEHRHSPTGQATPLKAGQRLLDRTRLSAQEPAVLLRAGAGLFGSVLGTV